MFWNIKKIYGWIAVLSLAGLTAGASIHRFAAGTATWESRVMIAPVILVIFAIMTDMFFVCRRMIEEEQEDATFRDIFAQMNPFRENINGNKT